MAMQIHGNYDHSGNNYAEAAREKQAAERAEKAKEAEKTAETRDSDRLSEPKDEYISSEKSGKKPAGLYRVGRDENGNRKIFYEEKCVTNTDKVDREIKKLKEKKLQLEQQIKSASGDEKKIRELEKKLAHVENELSQKDNDTYRKRHASVSQ